MSVESGKYRIMFILKVETDIINSIAVVEAACQDFPIRLY